jgi:hypothetical protein
MLLVVRLLPARSLHFDPHVHPVDHANDVGRPQRTEPVKVLVHVSEAAAVISVMEDAPEPEVIENAALYVGFFQGSRFKLVFAVVSSDGIEDKVDLFVFIGQCTHGLIQRTTHPTFRDRVLLAIVAARLLVKPFGVLEFIHWPKLHLSRILTFSFPAEDLRVLPPYFDGHFANHAGFDVYDAAGATSLPLILILVMLFTETFHPGRARALFASEFISMFFHIMSFDNS